MGLGLNQAFEQSVLDTAEDALRNQILLLISNIEVTRGQVDVPVLSEPRLSQIDSNLFAQIWSTEGASLWKSPSLLGRSLPKVQSQQGEFLFNDNDQSLDQTRIFNTTLGVEWATEASATQFVIQVAESQEAYQKRLSRYKRQVGLWLLVLGGLMIVLLVFLLAWLLRPLERVAQQVGEIEEGERRRFDEDYPNEVSRLTQSLNQLLSFEEKRIARQKEVLGNLAHSLKTPLAVLKGLKYPQGEVRQEAGQQLDTMQNIIDYQLQSASAVGRRRFAKPIFVRKTTDQIVSSLQKLHAEKALRVTVDLPEKTQFFGDEGDWMEVVGNLLDNAFKWAKSEVRLTVSETAASSRGSHRHGIDICVEDDGPGIGAAQRSSILQRGVRLDSQTPGHGLGMHIVKAVVDAYDGEIEIESRLPQGTRFNVRLN